MNYHASEKIIEFILFILNDMNEILWKNIIF